MQPPEILEITQERFACDGGDGPLGHPRVFLTLGENGMVDCPYCGRRYVRKGLAAVAAASPGEAAAE